MQCKACSHPQRAEIEQARAAGESINSIARRFDLWPSALGTHLRKHVQPGSPIAQSSVLARLERLGRKATDLLESALDSADPEKASKLIGHVARVEELVARLRGELSASSVDMVRSRLGITFDEVERRNAAWVDAQSTTPEQAVERARDLIIAWNDAHPDRAVRIVPGARVRHALR